MSASSDAGSQALTVLLQLEADARRALELKALQFLMVNETRRLISYRQALLFAYGPNSHSLCVEAVSSIAVVDRDAPMMQWAEKALAAMWDPQSRSAAVRFGIGDVPDELAAGWRDFCLPYVAWLPLRTPQGEAIGGLWLAREENWTDTELSLLERLAETYAHAWAGLAHYRPARTGRWRLSRWLLTAMLAAAMFFPVRMSTLAPVEVVAKDPTVISAPIDGVINQIAVSPNQQVAQGDLLIAFDDTNARNQYEVADRTLSVALAEFRKATQAAFSDERTKAEVALLRSKVELASAERDYAKELLGRVTVSAPRNGIVIYGDNREWIGKPVQTGQRIMEVADPGDVHLQILLPVGDAIDVADGAEVKAFLDVDPLHPLLADITHASYRAEMQAGNLFAYRLDAKLRPRQEQNDVRIGWRGTAKIYGGRVPVFLYLLRRPISAIRQFFGI